MHWIGFFQRVFQIYVVLVLFCFCENIALPNKPPLEHCPLVENTHVKKCLLRDELIYISKWNYMAGYYCYLYTNVARFSVRYNLYENYPFSCNNSIWYAPAASINNDTIAVFDYKETNSLELLRNSFKTTDFFENYVKCCRDAENCCTNYMTDENIKRSKDSCPVVWDGWSCFSRTPINTTATLPCTSQAYASPDKVCTLESRKECLWNSTLELATWKIQTDYSPCAIAPVYLRRYNYHVVALYVCTACSLPAIIIFLAIPIFRETRRVILHRNLLIAIVLRNILTILSKKLIIIDALVSASVSRGVLESNTVGCRVLSFFVSAATNSTYACMLVDGYYLHKVIVRTFAKEPELMTLYIIVAVLTFVPSIIWANILSAHNRTYCWTVDTNGEQWAVDSFRVVILIINTILLLDIIRVMISKMKQGGTTRQTKAAFRATLFLIPLFGLHIFITAKKIVINDTCLAEDIYEFFRFTMEASQGICVAVLFCYANTEVHNELNNAVRKLTIHLHQRYGWNSGRKTVSRRRTTTATYVQGRDSRSEF